ncbi:hypothetical protein [Microbacterium sp. SLBN-146]|uniref:hypothetical protein n=1 Tax=Microbacterium sp. SLBN-146 TaxID=2768457 RepID=UPI001151DDE2|nr:hypothetical protein [Microbacterium sp. SLBN-146]TQJ32048.1 hypothetical protein FBY39_2543 [Microbacterium sp. SLBN-146]
MTEPEHPDTPLTRKQLRELRKTGATPVIVLDDSAADPADDPTPVIESAPEPEPTPAPLPRPAEPAAVGPAPIADADVDLGVAPLTRRQARQQERIRTASVPVITPDLAAAHAASVSAIISESSVPVASGPIDSVPQSAPATEDHPVEEWSPPEDLDTMQHEAPDVEVPSTDPGRALERDVDEDPELDAEAPVDEVRPIVNPALGEDLIAGEPVQIDLPPSFDQLLARGSTGSVGTPNALILSQTTGDLPITSVTATGEVIITGTFNLPEGLGSTGHAPGTADGKDVDAVLIDGELPAHSSPTPIAASAAISTVKSAGDVIKPPVPEKGSRLMMWLAITAGALFLALAGVLIVAIVNGVFS